MPERLDLRQGRSDHAAARGRAQGHVYQRSSSNPPPDLVFAYRGGFVDFNAVARVYSHKASIRASFETIPDVPLSRVIVEMRVAKMGLIVNSRNLCAKKSRASAEFTAHSRRKLNLRPVVGVRCGKGKKRK